MCESSNSVEIVDELLKYVTVADFSLREELVLKIAILTEKFAPNVQWYVDATIDLIERAGEYVSEDIWHRVIQLVTNNDDMKQYAANKVIEALKRGGAYEALVSVAAFILGEFGTTVRSQYQPLELFHLLQERFPASSTRTKGLLLTSYLKLALMEPENQGLKQAVMSVFQYYSQVIDAELQQRAVEYLVLIQQPISVTLQYIQPMPKWEGRESSLIRRLAHDFENEQREESEFGERGGVDLSVPMSLSHTSEPNGTTGFPTLADTAGMANPTTNGTSQGIDDLDDLLSAPAPPAPEPILTSSDPFMQSGDQNQLIGGPPPAITLAGDLSQWFNALAIKDKGILYEDTFLQVKTLHFPKTDGF